jgi:MFS family permease
MTDEAVAPAGEAAVPAPTTSVGRASGYAWYALAIMTLVYMMSFIDRQILSILAERIKADLAVDDAQLGFLYGTAFAIFYTIFGIPLGRLADRWYRGRLMAIGLAVWSAMTTLSGLASTYSQLAVARVGVGVGEASASPAAFSMLAGYFPKQRRALAMAIYSSGVYLGMGLSLPIGGSISAAWDRAYTAAAPFGLRGWQVAFLAVGLPGLLLALWVWSIHEPARVTDDGKVSAIAQPGAWRAFAADLGATIPPFTFWSLARHPGALQSNLRLLAICAFGAAFMIWLTGDKAQWIAYGVGVYAVGSWAQKLSLTDPPTYRLIWGTPGVVMAILGFGGLAIITYSFGFWVAPYAMRTFKIGADVVGTSIGIPGTIASAAGVIIGGRLSDAWKARNPRGRIYVGMLAAAAPVPFMCAMFLVKDFSVYALISPIVYLLANMWAGSAVAAYQDFVLPRMYGTIGATYLLGSTMVGLALGPYFSGKVAAVTGSLQWGVFSLLIVPPITLFFLWQVARRAGDIESTKLARARAAGEGRVTNG